jgi:hypothetical protein
MARGSLFSIDAVAAILLFISILLTINYMSEQAMESPFARLQAVRLGHDLASVLDKSGALASNDQAVIEFNMNRSIPGNLEAHISTETYYKENGTFNLLTVSDYGAPIPRNSTLYITSYEYVGISNSKLNNYSIAKVVVWFN